MRTFCLAILGTAFSSILQVNALVVSLSGQVVFSCALNEAFYGFL